MRARHIVAGLGVAVLIAAGGGYVYVQDRLTTPMDPTGEAPRVEFEVPKGATLRRVGALLEEAGMIEDARWWRVYLKVNPGAPAPKAGRHEISPAMTIEELLAALAEKPLPDDVPLTMVEGWRLRDADAKLAELGLIEPGAYAEAAERPEDFDVPFPLPEGADLSGYLLPETYLVDPGPLDVQRLIQRQIDAFDQRFFRPSKAEIEESPRTLHEIVIMASMLEREEPKPELRPKVAGVLYKRLDSDVALGVDATSRFTLEDWNDRRAFLKKLRDPKDPYNTRLKTGLPPGPIGAPGLESLNAALHPESSPYWYYLHDENQQIHFARTAEEHEANRRRYNVW